MIKKPRKLPDYLRFTINIIQSQTNMGQIYFYVTFGHNGVSRYDYRLTPSQWAKAKKYLTRELVPFRGYEYKAKDEYKKELTIEIK